MEGEGGWGEEGGGWGGGGGGEEGGEGEGGEGLEKSSDLDERVGAGTFGENHLENGGDTEPRHGGEEGLGGVGIGVLEIAGGGEGGSVDHEGGGEEGAVRCVGGSFGVSQESRGRSGRRQHELGG